MRNPKFLLVLWATTAAFLMSSCKVDRLEAPIDYTFERNGVSTVDFNGQTTRIRMATELVDGLIDFDQTPTTLVEMYTNKKATGEDADPYEDPTLNASTKNIKSKVASSRDFFSANAVEGFAIKSELESWIELQFDEIVLYANQLASKGVAGQIADGSTPRYVNAKGLEYNQAVAKSLIGALMVDQMCNNYLSQEVLDEGSNITDNNQGAVVDGKPYTMMEHKWDEAYGYLFGATDNPTRPMSSLGSDDKFLNKYLGKVDQDSDFAGIADDIFEAFKLGRAAITSGDYKLRDDQANVIKEAIAKVVAVRAVYYLQQGKKALQLGATGAAFHDLSEGYGFIYSLRFTRKGSSSEPYFTRSEVDGYIESLLTGKGFWDVSTGTLDELSESIAAKFDFTVSQAAE